MSTLKQIQASPANGARSKGPTTPQGKLNSSRNSTRHGLLAETVVLEAEDRSRFLQLLDDLKEEHQPRTVTENILVETIAAAHWRQRRILGMQKVAFDHDVESCSTTEVNPLRAVLALRGSPDSIRTHELLLRYEIALDRQISRALLRLHQLQDRRLQATARPGQPAEEPISQPTPERKPPGSEHQKETTPAKRIQQTLETTAMPNLTPARRNPGPGSSAPGLTPVRHLRPRPFYRRNGGQNHGKQGGQNLVLEKS